MGKNKNQFKQIAIKYVNNNYESTSVFSIDSPAGEFIDPVTDTIMLVEFLVYGFNEDEEIGNITDKIFEDDFSKAIQIGSILGYHIPVDLIVNHLYDPYTICDDHSALLESVYSVVKEFADELEQYMISSIFFIDEINTKQEYQNRGYEKVLLRQLPAFLSKALRIDTTILMYKVNLLAEPESERDIEAEEIMAHRYKFEERKKSKNNEKNIKVFPPKLELTENNINYLLGRRIPGKEVTKSLLDQSSIRVFKSIGFKELGQSGWMYKYIKSIYE